MFLVWSPYLIKTEALRNSLELHSELMARTTPGFLRSISRPSILPRPRMGSSNSHSLIQPDQMTERRVPKANVEKVTTSAELSSLVTFYLLSICKENGPYLFVSINFRNISQSTCPSQNKNNKKALLVPIWLLRLIYLKLFYSCYYLLISTKFTFFWFVYHHGQKDFP